MQDYRTARPHDPADCADCAPTGRGHQLCQAPECEQIAVRQTLRHATLAEYDALPEAYKPIDGVAMKPVYACDGDAHTEATLPFCTHPVPAIPPCPTCGASGTDSCTTANGSPRTIAHAVRPTRPEYETCTHAHREDCGVFDGCQCSMSDQPPARTPRQILHDPRPDGSRSQIPWELAKPLIEQWDIPLWTVFDYATGQAQDTAPALIVTYKLLDDQGNLANDGHGHEVLETVAIPLDPETVRPVIRMRREV